MAQEASAPRGLLYRVGRLGSALNFSGLAERQRQRTGRFDDTESEHGVLYSAESPVTCYVELFAPLRQNLHTQKLLRTRGGEPSRVLNLISDDWLSRNVLAPFRLRAGCRFLDFRATETFTTLRNEFPDLLVAAGYADDFDGGDAIKSPRWLSQFFSRTLCSMSLFPQVRQRLVLPRRNGR